MKIKIIKSSSPFYWYNDKIGSVYRVGKKRATGLIRGNYILWGGGFYVEPEDCEQVSDETPTSEHPSH